MSFDTSLTLDQFKQAVAAPSPSRAPSDAWVTHWREAIETQERAGPSPVNARDYRAVRDRHGWTIQSDVGMNLAGYDSEAHAQMGADAVNQTGDISQAEPWRFRRAPRIVTDPPKPADPRSAALSRAVAADRPLDGWAR